MNVNCFVANVPWLKGHSCECELFLANVPWLKGHSYECELFCSECSLTEGSQL